MISESTKPNFIVRAGEFQINDAGSDLYSRHEKVKAEVAELDRAWAGAFLAAIFLNNPWLGRFTLKISTRYELDDEGCYYRTYSPVVSCVTSLGECSLSSTAFDGGRFCPELANDHLADEIDGHARDLYQAIADPDATDVSVELRRDAFASHLDGGAIDGRTAYLAFFNSTHN
ncbi:hypothetical protein POK33_39655 [Burkholderia cenocepacia]|uniref:hypothetical protein n=1 Tax=Burkholderia cenocepacia TaxID=95486 RepID=UPI0023B9AF32|nr:hypothetical protein [Burkholderia cenocepacia]MDF0506871.1 hypothetical protein [Burkholderia cenocepacia]